MARLRDACIGLRIPSVTYGDITAQFIPRGCGSVAIDRTWRKQEAIESANYNEGNDARSLQRVTESPGRSRHLIPARLRASMPTLSRTRQRVAPFALLELTSACVVVDIVCYLQALPHRRRFPGRVDESPFSFISWYRLLSASIAVPSTR